MPLYEQPSNLARVVFGLLKKTRRAMPLISFPNKNTYALLFQTVSRGVTKTESVSLVWE